MTGFPPMDRGAIGVLDALGFKGIWRDYNPQQVLTRLADVTDRAVRFASTSLPGLQISVEAFSDSVIVGCPRPPAGTLASVLKGVLPEPQVVELLADWFTVTAVSSTCARIVAFASEGAPPLAYRGAIAFGDVLSAGRFVIGPAIDHAAESERLAEAALVWPLPSAAAVVDRVAAAAALNPDGWSMPLRLASALYVRDYSVPLKIGQELKTYTVNPLFGETDDSIVARLLQAFRASVDVVVVCKRQNTEKFLERARAEWRRGRGSTGRG